MTQPSLFGALPVPDSCFRVALAQGRAYRNGAAAMMPRLSGEVMHYDDDAPTVRDSLDNINEQLLSITEEIAKVARPPMRHHCPIPGPVRWDWIDSDKMPVPIIEEGTALRLLCDEQGPSYVVILSGAGELIHIDAGCVRFPINGPTNEPPQWAPEVAVLGPVTP